MKPGRCSGIIGRPNPGYLVKQQLRFKKMTKSYVLDPRIKKQKCYNLCATDSKFYNVRKQIFFSLIFVKTYIKIKKLNKKAALLNRAGCTSQYIEIFKTRMFQIAMNCAQDRGIYGLRV